MKKFRKTIFFITIGMAVIIFLGLLSLILSPKTAADSTYDIVILIISAVSIAIALYSQLEADKDSRRVTKMAKELAEMSENVNNDVAIDKNVRYKLDKIIALDEQIYKKVGGRKKTSNLVQDSKKQINQKTKN